MSNSANTEEEKIQKAIEKTEDCGLTFKIRTYLENNAISKKEFESIKDELQLFYIMLEQNQDDSSFILTITNGVASATLAALGIIVGLSLNVPATAIMVIYALLILLFFVPYGFRCKRSFCFWRTKYVIQTLGHIKNKGFITSIINRNRVKKGRSPLRINGKNYKNHDVTKYQGELKEILLNLKSRV